MIAEIEAKILEVFKEKYGVAMSGSAIHEFDIGMDFSDLKAYPAVSIATENVGVRSVTDGTIEFKPRISIYQVFKNVGKPDQRRLGIYPIVVACVKILSGDDLNLEIDNLQPVSCGEIYHEKLKEMGAICFKTQFETSFTEDAMDDQDIVHLLSEGLSYYLGSENDTPDATDNLTFEV